MTGLRRWSDYVAYMFCHRQFTGDCHTEDFQWLNSRNIRQKWWLYWLSFSPAVVESIDVIDAIDVIHDNTWLCLRDSSYMTTLTVCVICVLRAGCYAYWCLHCYWCSLSTRMDEYYCGPSHCCGCSELFRVGMRTKIRTMYGIRVRLSLCYVLFITTLYISRVGQKNRTIFALYVVVRPSVCLSSVCL